jgi:hypothetical protein
MDEDYKGFNPPSAEIKRQGDWIFLEFKVSFQGSISLCETRAQQHFKFTTRLYTFSKLPKKQFLP